MECQDESLFWVVTACGIFSSFTPLIVNMILQIMSQESELESNLRRQFCDLKAEMGGINMVDEFAKYAKIQRKLNKVTEELSHQAQVRSSYVIKVRLSIQIILYTLMASLTMYLIWRYNDTAILTLPKEWLYPFGWLLAFPSGVEGSISILPWLTITTYVGNLVAKCFH